MYAACWLLEAVEGESVIGRVRFVRELVDFVVVALTVRYFVGKYKNEEKGGKEFWGLFL